MTDSIFTFVYAKSDWTPECREVESVEISPDNKGVKLTFVPIEGKPRFAVLPNSSVKMVCDAIDQAYKMEAPNGEDTPAYLYQMKGQAGDGLYCSRIAPAQNEQIQPSEYCIIDTINKKRGRFIPSNVRTQFNYGQFKNAKRFAHDTMSHFRKRHGGEDRVRFPGYKKA